MYDNGQGEQRDVIAALGFLKDRGCSTLFLAGYSFGSRINASVVAGGGDITDHIMISPPVAFMSFDDIDTLPSTGLIITGKNDDIAPPKQIRAHIDRWRIAPHFEILPRCDHFYSGCLDHLRKALLRYIP
jgi:alpha/beta superfamily hydrolase